jgi:hypothetical protein
MAVCTLTTLSPKGVEGPGTSGPPGYSVDGVKLGMTEEQIRSAWGKVEYRWWYDGTLMLYKRGPIPPLNPEVVFDRRGKVVAVSGRRLRYGRNLVVGPEHAPATAERLGKPVEPKMIYCGIEGPLRTIRRGRDHMIFEAVVWNHDFFDLAEGKTLEQSLEEHPEYSGIALVTLRDRAHYETGSDGIAEARLSLAADIVVGCRGLTKRFSPELR